MAEHSSLATCTDLKLLLLLSLVTLAAIQDAISNPSPSKMNMHTAVILHQIAASCFKFCEALCRNKIGYG